MFNEFILRITVCQFNDEATLFPFVVTLFRSYTLSFRCYTVSKLHCFLSLFQTVMNIEQ